MNVLTSVTGSTSSAYREGKILVVPSGSVLPAKCVKCGAPSETHLTKTFHWHSSWVYLLILLGLIFYVIVALAVQRKARIEVPFCQAHRYWRTRMNIAGAVLLVGSVPASILLAALDVNGGVVALIAGLIAFSGLIVLAIVGSSFSPVYIDGSCAKFKGAGEGFLSVLPSELIATAS